MPVKSLSPAGAEQSPIGPAAVRRVEAVVNPLSGGVGPGAADTLGALLADFGLDCRVWVPEPGQIAEVVREAVEAAPDLLIVLAGDGTARLAAELCGPTGPLLAPLPGGTMNMLPRALYGNLAWREALAAALSGGEARWVAGGEIGGRRFYCVAIVGSPALWALAREAARSGKVARAWRHAKFALRRAFLSHLQFQAAGQARHRAMALSLICPLISRRLGEQDMLEAAALDLHDALEAFRLGLNNLLGDWRNDPAVTVEMCEHGRVWAKGRIPALLDGELTRLERSAEIRFRPKAFRALAPQTPTAHPAAGRPI